MRVPEPPASTEPAPVPVCAVVLAAGQGSRLRPLTERIPKALCPVGNVTLLDRALARLAHHGLAGPAQVAVNACHLADQIVEHVGSRAFVAREPGPTALGTAGGVANLRSWVAGRAVLAGNADAYLAPRACGGSPAGEADSATADLAPMFAGWDGMIVRVLCVPATDAPPEFGQLRFAGFSLLPPAVAAGLPARRSELVSAAWRPAERTGRLELVCYDGLYLDTGTPADYLAANLHAVGPGCLVAPDAVVDGTPVRSTVGASARVYGRLTRSVVLPGGYVAADEHLVDAIRAGKDLTMYPYRS